ncbi:MAG: ATP synthase F1 subunit gamma [Bacteroidales bacterium]|jgi:F-type H+-transporting ATPase subunit gamma|nr:ATP synthase F1 subunit gamma [Bacteroidales bacterium]
MANLKEVRNRIESVKSTQQITSAMKLVAASKLRKAQGAILQLRPYAQKLQEFLQGMSAGLDQADEAAYSDTREIRNVLLVVVTSNRGLCGAFNSNVIKQTEKLINTAYQDAYKSGTLSLFCVGKKGAEYFSGHGFPVVKQDTEIFDQLNFENAMPLAESLMQEFADKKYDRIDIIYNQFKNAAVQALITEQFLPILPPEDDGTNLQVDYIFEPNKEDIVRELVPKSLKIQFFKALLDSYASEHGARMTAMHMATDNANELLKELKLTYNKARQSAITNEILEIVSGAEALKG